jgi:hypothetical protein
LAAILALGVAVTGCGDDGGGPGGSGAVGGGGAGGVGPGGAGGGGAGGDGGMGGGLEPCTEDLCVGALPRGTTFDPSITVELIASGPDSAGATIYYTTDLTDVDPDASPEYTGPITLTEATVLKFQAVAAGAGGAGGGGGAAGPSVTPEESEGYTLATGPTAFIYEQWATSGHGDMTSVPWRRFDPGPVSTSCAQCHSAFGFLDYALDGLVTEPNPPSLGLECSACHTGSPSSYFNPFFSALEPVQFPVDSAEAEASGDPIVANLSLFGSSNMCLVCHQGRKSGQDVDNLIEAKPGGPHRFVNVHYYAAAATLFGSESNAGYEYVGNEYLPRNTFPSHGDDFSTCEGCHMTNAENGENHTWRPDLAFCQSCHSGDSFDTLGGTPGQSYTNIQALLPELLAEIEDYADTEIGVPIVYDGQFCNDNGEPCSRSNAYTVFDDTLLKAAYNYQVALKDPNGFIHSGTYIQQILYDSIEDLDGTPSVQVIGRGNLTIDGSAIGTASKTQQWQLSGHANADSEVFRHWDEDLAVQAACSRCHNTAGFAELAMGQSATTHLPLSTVGCTSCHNNFNLFAMPSGTETRWDDLTTNPALEPVEFPSGETATYNNNSNLCMTCHQGRSSTDDVNDATPNGVNDPLYDSYSFINIHYYAAGATLFGNDVRGGYQYEGDTYRGQNVFAVHTNLPQAQGLVDCIGCHMNSSLSRLPADPSEVKKHTFLPKVADCSTCHPGSNFETLAGIPSENFEDIQDLTAELIAAIEAYADVGGGLPKVSPVEYNGSAYPYWFKAGQPPTFPNWYLDFDFDMLTAAYNYQVALKDPGGYIHNGTYIKQILIDSIVKMGGTPSITRP